MKITEHDTAAGGKTDLFVKKAETVSILPEIQ